MLGPNRGSATSARHLGLEAKSPLAKALGRVAMTPYGLFALAAGLALTTLVLVVIVVRMPTVIPGRSAKMTVLDDTDRPPQRDILNMNEHIYTETDLPFFNETVVEYRRRLRPKLAAVRRGTIFVAISSFRDNFCQDTIRSLFQTAKDPKRIFVGVVDQMKPWNEPLVVNETLDIPCESQLDYQTQAHIRLVRLHFKSSRGPTHARYISSKLWDGEDIFLQIDAHANFLPNWDQELIDNIAAMPDPDHTILSHYPAPEAKDLGSNIRQWNCKVTTEWAPPGLLYQIPDWCRIENMADGIAVDSEGRKTTCYSPFIGAGFLAGKSQMLYDAPYDRYLPYLFHGEEILIGARLWTSGWNLFTPRLNLVTHRYGERRHNVYSETPNWDIPARRSEARARIILNSRVPADDEIDAEIDRRELAYAGVDWSTNPPTLQSRCSMRYDGQNWIPVETSDPV